MKLKLCAADPAGNVTLLVETPVPKEQYHTVANRLLALPELGGEQVGFLTEPRMGGAIRLEMMGGEFCGNAARCAGYYHARKTGCGRLVSVEISGCGDVLQVEVDEDSAWAEMPIPMAVGPVEVAGLPMTAVRFEGIVHLVASMAPLPRERVAELLPSLAMRFSAPAVGLMFLEGDGMTPAVYVRETDSLFWENSCASGSAAVACAMTAWEPDGIFRQVLLQPGGTISTEVIRRNGCTVSLRIGGKVTVGAPKTVELSGILQDDS